MYVGTLVIPPVISVELLELKWLLIKASSVFGGGYVTRYITSGFYHNTVGKVRLGNILTCYPLIKRNG